jgi:hypothetical protein
MTYSKKAYYIANREKILNRQKLYYLANPQPTKDRSNKFRQDHRGDLTVKSYFDNYRTERRQYIRDYQNERKRQARSRLIDTMGGCCMICKFSDHRGLHLDHINNDGKTDIIRKTGFSAKYYNSLSESEDSRKHLQLLCANCNWTKQCNMKLEFKKLKLQEARKNLILAMGNKCKHCGYNEDYRCIHLDHIDGGGNKDRKQYGCLSISKYTKMINDYSLREKFQLLCVNCNWVKRYTNDETTRKNKIEKQFKT